jgi:hypothetical protein
LVDVASRIGPPVAPAALAPAIPGQDQPQAQGKNQNNNYGYACDVDDFLHELGENEDDL